jgi:hypothetical protein
MKPRSGEKPPLRRSSRSRICRLVRSQEGKIFGARFEFGDVLLVEFKVDQFAAMRGNKMAVRFCSVYIH